MSKRQSRARTEPGHVRIISGQYRGRRLPVLSVDGLRPTGDRVRETLFNWLQNDLVGARCLDAFAGTGALGFEAASRYAESVTLVESNKAVAKALEQSRATLQAEHVSVVHQNFQTYVATQPEPYDIIFVDPPFQQTDFIDVLKWVQQVISPQALVYLECPKSLSDSNVLLPAAWDVRQDKIYGDVRARLCVAGRE